MPEKGKKTTAAIELKGIAAGYGQQNVLEDINLTIPPCDFLGIVGPNGGGKTTLLRIILGLLKPTRGQVIYTRDGIAVSHIDFGYLPQYNRVDRRFPASVNDVVLSGLPRPRRWPSTYSKEQKERARNLMEEMGISELSRRPIGSLSGGQLQRVLLARAVVGNPDVLVLDEPNTYVSATFQEEMYDILARLNDFCTVIEVTHDEAQLRQRAKRMVEISRKLTIC